LKRQRRRYAAVIAGLVPAISFGLAWSSKGTTPNMMVFPRQTGMRAGNPTTDQHIDRNGISP